MLLIVPWDMAGLSITLITSLLTTLRRMISGGVVSLDQELRSYSAMVLKTNIPFYPQSQNSRARTFTRTRQLLKRSRNLLLGKAALSVKLRLLGLLLRE